MQPVFVDNVYRPEGPKQPAARKPRHSSEIKSEIERVPLGLRALGQKVARCEKELADAKSRLAYGKKRLAELRDRGVSAINAELKTLVGYKYWSKAYQKYVFVPGAIEQLEESVPSKEREIPGLKKQLEVEARRVKGVLLGLNAELKEALEREASDGVLGRDAVTLARLRGGFGYDPNEDVQSREAEPGAYDHRMAEVDPF